MAFMFYYIVNFVSPPSLLDICSWIVAQGYKIRHLPIVGNIISRNRLGKGVVIVTKFGENVGTNQLETPKKITWLKLGVGTKVLVKWENVFTILIK